MMKKGFLKTDYLKIFVLDEADEMLSRGFKSQIQDIFKYLPSEIQIALFSATMPIEILKLTKHFIEKEEWKMEVLLDLYGNLDIN